MDLMTNIRALIKQAEEVQAQPNIATEQNIAMAQEQLAINAAALQSGNTVEGQQIESLQKGLATQSAQASGEDQVIQLQKAAAVMELVDQGLDFYSAVDAVADADAELQKEAAFQELMEQGYDFEDAVSLVKAASEGELYSEEFEKAAALHELLEAGYSFDDASEIVKEASILDKGRAAVGAVKGAVGKLGRDVSDVAKNAKYLRSQAGNKATAKYLRTAGKNVVKDNAKAIGGLGAATAAGSLAAGYGAKKAFGKREE